MSNMIMGANGSTFVFTLLFILDKQKQGLDKAMISFFKLLFWLSKMKIK